MEFEWDADKAARNRLKHNVSFGEAASALADPLSTTYPDEDHSLGEDRYVTIGESHRRQLLVVCHTERGDRIRIISARPATRAERKIYEEGT